MDTQIPQFVTHLDGEAVARASEYRNQITYLHAKVEQAERAQADAETAARRADERTQAEADRADGAEAWGRALLAEKILHAAEDEGIDPDRLTATAFERITNSLRDDWNSGTRVDDLDVVRHLRDWEADHG